MLISYSQLIRYAYMFFFLQVLEISNCAANKENPANGKNLNILPYVFTNILQATRNSTGHITSMAGASFHILEWLAAKLNFTYSMIQNDFQRNRSQAEMIILKLHFLANGSADMILGAQMSSMENFKGSDFTYAWLLSCSVLILPVPTISANLAAVWKPFSPIVWIFVACSFVFVLIGFHLLGFFTTKIEHIEKKIEKSQFQFDYSYITYMLEVILIQGSSVMSVRLPIRLASATWCLCGCILVLAYYSVIIAFVTAPNYTTLVDSFEELIKKPELPIVFVNGSSDEKRFKAATEGIGKLIGDRMRTHYIAKNTPEDCLDFIRRSSAVYLSEKYLAYQNMMEDVNRIGHCDFTFAKKTTEYVFFTLPVTKLSPYKEQFDQGIMTIEAFGLNSLWISYDFPTPKRCIDWAPPSELVPLTFRGLSGAFLVLGVGYTLSFISFAIEVLLRKCCKSF